MTALYWVGMGLVALLMFGAGHLFGAKVVIDQWAAHELHRMDPEYEDSDIVVWQAIKEIADNAKARQAAKNPVRAEWLAQYNEAYKVKQ